MPTATISLYEDWAARRDRLLLPTVQASFPSALPHVKVLEFLLSRYRDADVAHQAAMFPLPSEIVFNQRAIIINHHLGSRRVAGVKTADEAATRMSSILSRMHGPESNDDDGQPWPGNSTLWTPRSRRPIHRTEDRYLALASGEYNERAAALDHFRRLGKLQDTSLLSDLAALPTDDDRFASERRSILSVMRGIGLRSRE
ncbi:MAG: hypothetical protein SGJ19_07485 [Planctomycetia bacterium]|nr:hypothetical protein [Planctomycetia bacterium]